jgi:preprotein translocase subunit SecE
MSRSIKKGAASRSAPAKKSRISFLFEVIAELRKAQWPTKQEALRLSLLVIAICAIVGAVLGALDYGFYKLFADLLLGS